MNLAVFLDSGYLIALIRKRDNFHRAASEAVQSYAKSKTTFYSRLHMAYHASMS